MGEPANEYRIHSVTFGEEFFEVVFHETRHESADVVTIQTQLIRPTLYLNEIQSIQEDIGDLIDRSFVHRRNPTMRGVPAQRDDDEE